MSPAHTRAWIETRAMVVSTDYALVARSHAGVDRNLSNDRRLHRPSSRPLTRGRGSKPRCQETILSRAWSPAHTRAWIETRQALRFAQRAESRPLTRGRGSKRMLQRRCRACTGVARSHAGVDRNNLSNKGTYLETVARSHAGVDRNRVTSGLNEPITGRPLTRGRGSKPGSVEQCREFLESPAHTRAWIETQARPLRCSTITASPAHTRAWIETAATSDRSQAIGLSPAHTRAWIEITAGALASQKASRRPLTRGRGSNAAMGFPKGYRSLRIAQTSCSETSTPT